jgi:hypothetical protein
MVQISSELEVQIVQVILTIWHAPTNPAIRHILFVVSRTGFFFFDSGVVFIMVDRISRNAATTKMMMPIQILWA